MNIFKEAPRWMELWGKQMRNSTGLTLIAARCGSCIRMQTLSHSKFSTAACTRVMLRHPNNTLSLARKQDLILKQKPFFCWINLILRKNYGVGTGEMDKLWAAATGGRGVGRGRKKKINKGVEEGVLTFGKAKISWPGFTKPISSSDEKGKVVKPFVDRRGTGIPVMNLGPPRYGNFISRERGWSGGSMGGKHAGAPRVASGEELEGFDSIIIEIRRITSQTTRGRRRAVRAIVACGNGKGAAGWAIGNALQPRSAVWKARNKAGNYLYNLPICDNHTIFHNVKATVNKTRIRMERRPQGHGIKSQRIIKAIANLAGYKDIYARIETKCTSPLSVIRATFNCFLAQETHAELAERTGKYVVEFRPETGNRPIIVGTPSDEAVSRRIEKEAADVEEDELAKAFDPFKGLHRPKQLVQRSPRYVKTKPKRPKKLYNKKQILMKDKRRKR